jgi:hypothetical protein
MPDSKLVTGLGPQGREQVSSFNIINSSLLTELDKIAHDLKDDAF